MKLNRMMLSIIVTIIAAISISSCVHRSYGPGYDYGYGYGHDYRYYRVPPPPPRVVVVKKPNRPHVVRADRHRSSRYNSKAYRRQNNSGNHYGQRNRTRGPR